MVVLNSLNSRYRSRADFAPDDFRLHLPRFSEENFSKNLVLADKIKVIAEKYNATPSQVTLAWILASYSTCECPVMYIHFLYALPVVPVMDHSCKPAIIY